MAGSALAIGSVHTITLCVVTAVLAVAAVLAWWGAEPIRVRPAATLLLFTGIGLCAYTALQCVPMPIRWLAVIAPHNADVWSRALVPLREAGPRWAPITLDPPGTRIELVKGVAYLLAFVTALRIAHRREGVAFLGAVIAITGVTLGATALLHPAFGAHKVFGIYEPRSQIAQVHIAPILNANSLAGYLNIAFCITLAAVLPRDIRGLRAIAIALTMLLGATQIWVASRGGVIAMVLGAMTVAALGLGGRVRRRDSRTWVALGCGAATLIGGSLIIFESSESVQSQLLVKDLSKFAVLPNVIKMLPAYGIFGVGRGAFESVFPQFREATGFLTATHPENVVVQWIVEWGVPLGTAGLISIALALRPWSALVRSSTATGAWAALAAFVAQNMAELGTEIPGVMISAVVCAAIVVAGSAGVPPRWTLERWSLSPGLVAKTGAVLVLLALMGGVTALGHGVVEDRRLLHDTVTGHSAATVSSNQMRGLARAAMLRHPAEPYLPFAVALRAARAHDENPVPWLGATLERARVYGPAHLLLARVVAARSPSQARLEYRLAVEQDPGLWGQVNHDAPLLVASYDDAMELVSESVVGNGMLHSLLPALGERLPATCVRLDEELSRREPQAVQPMTRAAESTLEDLDAGDAAPWCQDGARAGCIERALSLARKVEQLDPATCYGQRLEARALAAAGFTAQAMDRLARAADRVTDRVTCLQALAGVAQTAHDGARFDTALSEIARAGCADEKECMSNLTWVARTYEASGNPGRALATVKRAYERAPDNDLLLESAARLAAAAGLNAEAFRDYQELARRHPGDVRWRTAAEVQHEAMLRAVTKF
jgi:tetratricopeptide (TPR) repeat protein